MRNEFADYPGIGVKPGRVGGKLTLGESRVPAEQVAECLDEGERAEEIADHYDLNLADVLRFKQHRDSHKPAATQS